MTPAERTRAWRAANPERARANKQAWKQRHPEKHAAHQRRSQLKRKYGISPEDYDRMVVEQDGRCLICGEEKVLVVDHDHTTGEVRELLCFSCNGHLSLVEQHGAAVFAYLCRGTHV